MRLYCCILKGKTTTLDQFDRFVDSFWSAWKYVRNLGHVKICPYFFINDDACVKIMEKYLPMEEVEILKRDDDPGELRNEFLARMQMIDGKGEPEGLEYFTFFDGDDQICENYFYQNYGSIQGRGFALGNPVAVYSDKGESDKYPLKWCMVANSGDIYKQTLLDKIGGQSWGRIYEMNVAKIAKFGRGLFEDVTFMYSVVSHYRNPVLFWDMIYFWRRDNTNALTRTSATVPQIKDGMDNLDTAKEIALEEFDSWEPEVYRRYTIGVLVLIRNSAKVEGGEKAREYILGRLDRYLFRVEEILEAEPKFKDKLLEDFPEFYNWAYKNEVIGLGGVCCESNGDSARGLGTAGGKSDSELETVAKR